MFSAGKHFPSMTSHQTTLQGVVYQMDVALEDIETQRSGIVFIYNMTGSKYANFDYELSQKILGLLKGAYPARLKKVLIVTAPLWFKAPFKILRLFVREKLRDRVFMVNVSQLPIHVPLNALPRELGGQLDVNHKSWLTHCLKSQSSEMSELCNLTSSKSFSLSSSSAQQDSPILCKNSNNVSSQQANNGFSDEDEPSSTNSEKCIQLANNIVDKNGSIGFMSSSDSTTQMKAYKIKPDLISVPSPDISLDKDKYKSGDTRTSYFADSYSFDEDDSQGITLEEFIQHLKDNGRKGLYDEYNEIKSRGPDGTFEVSRFRANQSKNRYTDVLCYDHSRVKLSLIDDDPNSDYINANYVDGYKQKNAFISTQGIGYCF
jgi:tyrosine-protein phosphatase non-receptor type 9